MCSTSHTITYSCHKWCLFIAKIGMRNICQVSLFNSWPVRCAMCWDKLLSHIWLFETTWPVVRWFLCPWYSPGTNTGLGGLALLQTFLTYGLNHISFFFPFIFISWRLITLQYCSGFCHTLTCYVYCIGRQIPYH